MTQKQNENRIQARQVQKVGNEIIAPGRKVGNGRKDVRAMREGGER